MKTLKSWNANQYMANLNPVVVKHEVDASGISVLVNTSKGKRALGFWIDFWVDSNGDLNYDWNQFSFALWNDIDCMRKEMQETPEFFEVMTNAALAYVGDNYLFVENQ